MASHMTTKEKLTHPVAAIKEMMGKGDSHTTGTHTGTHTAGTHTGTHVPGTHTGTHVPNYTHTSGTHNHNEAGVIGRYEVPTTGVTHTTPTTMGNEEQLMGNQMGGTPTMGTTAGSGARPVFSEAGHQGIGHQGIGHQGIGHEGIGHQGIGHEGIGHQGIGHEGIGHQGIGHQGVGPHQAKFGVDPASSAAAYEGQEHAGHLPGSGAVGMLGAAASKIMPGHHNKHTDTSAAHTGTTGLGAHKNVL
ncbi:hypothetical protein KFL_000190180 [Klebsormidium nitens]|uniref:Uncharacterized protein n=1 Tax=Klebsormidium nitens TaxID=105231 RepID=A0A1Y1HNP7_KLENI|nr:hypothetical protein KFL_000190180 [Klebsormidium nitens]|eukprot:GAQ78799.1 hypothetical protein KFL_000190180 [Klebsormidium nitens]